MSAQTQAFRFDPQISNLERSAYHECCCLDGRPFHLAVCLAVIMPSGIRVVAVDTDNIVMMLSLVGNLAPFIVFCLEDRSIKISSLK